MGSWSRILSATEGSDSVALGNFLATTGLTTYDGGFVNTASTKSSITYIDGDAGILRYRGIPIDQLAERSTFIEVSYLLIYGEPPTTEQLEDFTDKIRRHTLLHEDLKRFFDGFAQRAPDAGAVVGGQRVECLLPGLARPQGPRTGRAVDDPPACETADDRGLRAGKSPLDSPSCTRTTR